jgi:hypothetical protein
LPPPNNCLGLAGPPHDLGGAVAISCQQDDLGPPDMLSGMSEKTGRASSFGAALSCLMRRKSRVLSLDDSLFADIFAIEAAVAGCARRAGALSTTPIREQMEGDMVLKPCKFTFDDTPSFDGFDLGSTWNGFDNVSVTPTERERIAAYFKNLYGDDYQEAVGDDLESIEVGQDGLVCLGWGFATQIVRD